MSTRRHVLRSAAALAPLLAVACAAGPGSPTDPALTRAQAERVMARYAAIAGHAVATLDGAGLAVVETGTQLTMDRAAIRLARATRRIAPPPASGGARYYIPRMNDHPRWFAVDARDGASRRHALLFVQDRPDGPWLLAAGPAPGADVLGRVALDAHGYATAVRPAATGYGVAPARMGALHADLLTRGTGAPGATGLAAGPSTTRAYADLRTGAAALRRRGVRRTTSFTSDGPVFGLRTSDGGALVWYAMRQREAYRTAKPGRLDVPADLVGLTGRRRFRARMISVALIQYLAVLPQTGPATVAGETRRAVAAAGM
ncbi:hypothetical protein [Actinomadura rayongensis]|uniref:DUF8094 domain-containing protein n=1 Tax=Actinomadura rayongensis TaxID=1429076 RepID=A0A6I4W520_9ACTN|nr:hypothetical protein [Actinomadura rayongensis]MXQ64551.1 hypothetical protein [Actinomadura rayongensis]